MRIQSGTPTCVLVVWAWLGLSGLALAADDWPVWRGPDRNGIAAADQAPPREWSKDKNVLWTAPIPGRGHSSPIVVGPHVYLTTADEKQEIQSVLCVDRTNGKQLWRTDVHEGGFVKGNAKASHASSTIACDGERLFVNFLNGGAVYTTALDRQGKQLWQTEITRYKVHQGYGSSPALFGSLVIVTADNKAGGAVVAMRRDSGEIVWKHDRPKKPNYASPIILNVAGRDQLILTGCDLVSSFDPATGKKLWETEGATTECVTSTVTDGELIYSSGGYPKNHMAAVRADGSKDLVWSNRTRVYVPSMLIRDGYLFAVGDAGVAVCLKADTGETAWKARIGGTFTSSPVLVGNHIYVTDESGKTTIFAASSEEFRRVAENQLGGEVFATPTIVGGRIYYRAVSDDPMSDGKRQEMLYCLSE